jgi:hypothetical protein
MKSVLKAPGTMLLKLGYDEPLSNVAFNFNLRRYTVVPPAATIAGAPRNPNTHSAELAWSAPEADGRALFFVFN